MYIVLTIFREVPTSSFTQTIIYIKKNIYIKKIYVDTVLKQVFKCEIGTLGRKV